MIAWRDHLRRFRPVGVAGAAAQAGVPVDREAETRSELAPVFDLLTDVEAELVRTREAARAEARRRIDEARRQAEGIVAAARDRAATVRAEAAAQVRADAGRAPSGAVEAAVARIRDRAARRLPALVELAVTSAAGDMERGPG